MFVKFRLLFLAAFSIGCAVLSADEKGRETAEELRILGKVPEGWEVVELTDAPAIEKWVKLNNGEDKMILVRPFGIRPIVDEQSKFTVVDPLKTPSGQRMDNLLNEQNEHLAASGKELSIMLTRLKELLLTLPSQTSEKKES